jgi:hypothetical protein
MDKVIRLTGECAILEINRDQLSWDTGIRDLISKDATVATWVGMRGFYGLSESETLIGIIITLVRDMELAQQRQDGIDSGKRPLRDWPD